MSYLVVDLSVYVYILFLYVSNSYKINWHD